MNERNVFSKLLPTNFQIIHLRKIMLFSSVKAIKLKVVNIGSNSIYVHKIGKLLLDKDIPIDKQSNKIILTQAGNEFYATFINSDSNSDYYTQLPLGT